MANIKSAKKRVLVAERNAMRNKSIKSEVKTAIKKAGFDNTTDLVRQLSFGAYNQKFKPNRTAADWLCADRVELDKYLADPLVRKDISSGLFRDLLVSMKRTGTRVPRAHSAAQRIMSMVYFCFQPS